MANLDRKIDHIHHAGSRSNFYASRTNTNFPKKLLKNLAEIFKIEKVFFCETVLSQNWMIDIEKLPTLKIG